jgi:hypothetical protein
MLIGVFGSAVYSVFPFFESFYGTTKKNAHQHVRVPAIRLARLIGRRLRHVDLVSRMI